MGLLSHNKHNSGEYGTTGGTTGLGATGHGHPVHEHSTLNGPNHGTGPGYNSGASNGQFTGGFGGGTAGPVGSHGTHTGPAPLAGVHANHGTAGVGSTARNTGAHTGTGAGGLSGNLPTEREAHKLDRKANMESKVGGLLHSTNMKAKAQDHAAQADHLRMQASELGEAQRLEQEAGMRRQRAVGLGADPTHASGTTGFGPGHHKI